MITGAYVEGRPVMVHIIHDHANNFIRASMIIGASVQNARY